MLEESAGIGVHDFIEVNAFERRHKIIVMMICHMQGGIDRDPEASLYR